MSRDLEQALERLLAENPARERSRSADAEAEAEALALYMTSRRLRRLRAQRAPDRLRRTAWNRAMAVPIDGKPRRRLWSVGAPPAWFAPAARVAASIIAAVTVGYGAVAASASAMPDSPLYPVKLVVEDFSITFSPAEHRADLLVTQANRRLDESQALADEGQLGRAERLVEDASQKIEGAKAFAPLASDPRRTTQGIESTVSRRGIVDESIDRVKNANDQKVGSTRPAPVVVAPRPVVSESSVKPAEEPPALPVDALALPAEPPSISAPAQVAPALPSGGAASNPAAVNSGQLAAPAAAAVHLLESSETAVPSPTRGGVSAPAQTVIPIEQATSAPTPTRTTAPVAPALASSPAPTAGTAGAPTGGVTILPIGGASPAPLPDTSRPAR